MRAPFTGCSIIFANNFPKLDDLNNCINENQSIQNDVVIIIVEYHCRKLRNKFEFKTIASLHTVTIQKHADRIKYRHITMISCAFPRKTSIEHVIIE